MKWNGMYLPISIMTRRGANLTGDFFFLLAAESLSLLPIVPAVLVLSAALDPRLNALKSFSRDSFVGDTEDRE